MNSSTLIIYLIRVYAIPVVIFLGCFLNILSFFVMKRFKSTASFYMTILALTDTGKKKYIYKNIK